MRSAVRKIQSDDSIALTFDDGPNPAVTNEVLNFLKDRQLRATFFVLGENCTRFPDIVRRMKDDGHQVGIHGYKHFRHIGKTTRISESLDMSISAIEAITGSKPVLFRPPYGWWQPGYNHLLKKRGLTLTLWSLMTEDYRHTTKQDVFQSQLRGITAGDIVVMHDNRLAAGRIRANLGAVADSLNRANLNTSFIEPIR